ncbi:MAG: YggS family pyridoxal phosphate-dependent enzyme [Pseudomonadales bacterium]
MSLQSITSDDSPQRAAAIAANVAGARAAIASAAEACGRNPADITLVAVSKTKPAALVRAAAAAGCGDFGENYLQDAVAKIESLADVPATWHFIGAIQSNKTRQIAEHFHWVHTVARQKIAERLSAQCPPDRILNVTLQVNVDEDPAKAGVDPAQASRLLAAVRDLPNLRVRGLMTILQRDSAPLASYRRLADLFESLRPGAPQPWDTLSMGMSGDFAEAIAAGATHVRIGTAIFGARDANP